jgi:hypothetical protein
MYLLYIGAILTFGAISLAILMGLDKLSRTSRDRGTHYGLNLNSSPNEKGNTKLDRRVEGVERYRTDQPFLR